MGDQRIVKTNALPENTIKPLPPGAKGIGDAVSISLTNQYKMQNTLTNQSGGIKKNKMRLRGGSPPVVVVGSAPSYYDQNLSSATNANNIKLAELANKVQSQQSYDNTVGKSQASVAEISSNNDKLYYGNKGGSKRRRSSKRGGSFPKWGCLSGGKTRRICKNCKVKRKKTCKHLKRHRQ